MIDLQRLDLLEARRQATERFNRIVWESDHERPATDREHIRYCLELHDLKATSDVVA